MHNKDYEPGLDYVPEGWIRKTPFMSGWSIPERAREYATSCSHLITQINASLPLGQDVILHNIYMSYAYALMLAARNKSKVSILDYGGAVGLYAVLSRMILPGDIEIEYHCKDVPAYKEYAEQHPPWVTFHTEDSTLQGKKFDFVLASGVIQCVEDWQELVKFLASMSNDLLFITRLSVVLSGNSFVISQKLSQFVNETLLWCLNREQFIGEMSGTKMSLLREFLLEPKLEVRNGPQMVQYRGYLFRKGQ